MLLFNPEERERYYSFLFILSYFGKKPTTATKRYPDFVRSGMDRGYKNPLAELSHSPIVGSREFVAEIKDKFLRKKQPDRDLPALRELSSTPELDYIEKAVDSVLHSEENLARQVKLHLYHRYSSMKLREIGNRFGIGQSGITQASRRIGIKAREDKRLKKTVKTIEMKITLSIM